MMLLTMKDLEKRTGIDRNTWLLWIRQGKLSAVRLSNKRVRVDEADFNAFIEARTVKAKR